MNNTYEMINVRLGNPSDTRWSPKAEAIVFDHRHGQLMDRTYALVKFAGDVRIAECVQYDESYSCTSAIPVDAAAMWGLTPDNAVVELAAMLPDRTVYNN